MRRFLFQGPDTLGSTIESSQKMQKPRLFIGSSSSQPALKVARAVQAELEFECEPKIWTQNVFTPTRSTLGQLEEELESSDAGVFIFMPEDTLQKDEESDLAVRDNVIFELGMWIGRLGSKSSFFLLPRGINVHIPSDLLGITPLNYDAERSDNNIQAAVGPACEKVRNQIEKNNNVLTSVLGLSDTAWFKGVTTEEIRFIDSRSFLYREGSSSDWKVHKYSFRAEQNQVVLHWKNGSGTYNAHCKVLDGGLHFEEPKNSAPGSEVFTWIRKKG